MSNQTINLTPELYDYILKNTLRESAVLKDLRVKTKKLPGSMMQIAPEQGQFMAMLIKLMGARNIIELGTYTGYSTLAMAEALPKDGKIITCDVCEETSIIAKQFWAQAGFSHKINLQLGPALETLEQLLNNGEAEQFDFAFIDADKANYDDYFELCLKLIRPGGLIAIDNVLWDGAVVEQSNQEKSTQAIRDFNSKRTQDARIDLSLVPIADGLTLARKI